MFQIILESLTLQAMIVVFAGLMLGSFSTAIIYRKRNGQSWIWNKSSGNQNKARSFCPACNHVLGVKDLIPVFSWVWQGGKCRYCEVKIPVGYIALECFLVFVSLCLWALFGFSWFTLVTIAMSPFVVAQVVLFAKYRKISYLLLGVFLMGMMSLFFLQH